MCGIAGILRHDSDGIEPHALKAMCDLMAHRGPDDSGYMLWSNGAAVAAADEFTMPGAWRSELVQAPSVRLDEVDGAGAAVALASRRLAIFDPGPRGHMPMCDPTRQVWIAHNGEVYNWRELAEELAALGHRFGSATDTEVILAAYLEWGTACASRFNGMWAFAIWDGREGTLHLSRDRFGIKPLHVYADARRLAFASEMKPLLGLLASREADLDKVDAFLRHGLLDHAEGTFFESIRRVPAAHWLTVTVGGGVHRERYWHLDVSGELDGGGLFADAAAATRALLDDAVGLRLRSDVPVGSCLSGGLDSSSIVMLAHRRLAAENPPASAQRAFSACFDDARFDERDYMQAVVDATGVSHHLVFPAPDAMLDDLDRLIWHQEEPFAASGVYSQWQVMEAARRAGVVVLLDGQGGDELLLGYRKFQLMYLRALHRAGRHGDLLAELGSLLASPGVLSTLNLRAGLRYARFGARAIGADTLLRRTSASTAAPSLGGEPGARIARDLFEYSLPVLLRYEDRNSMAHSVEARLPFLDYRLAERLAAMPIEHRIRRGETKRVLREAMRGVLPERVRARRSKLGFNPPQTQWMREGPLAESIERTFARARFIEPLVDLDELRARARRLRRGDPRIDPGIVFRCFITEWWGRRMIENDPSPAGA